MMSKLKLNPNATFKLVVNIPVIGGEPEPVELECKTRGIKEMQALYDRLPNETALSILSDVAVGWNLAEAFTPQNFALLLDNYPKAAMVIFNAYDAEIYNEREKN
ncbi:phage tail assembly chaperone [Wielerella bovis]|uniref:phage tail assembly chaperone n=1 Tax=Wielerella bovis TaxID=2917790 RepID=UPI002019E304|nr:phage tail assembly chaperone [Wielerella bovis]ULJ59741.1 phage tail assembly chaperone [Wielerella bovis]